ncbi:putative Sentrin/sumo-specific protease [Melia azedarach]|uniref:Sentrin/sumo-specific protease n=1 Tax=Melia azedarach TaxID=155640 RepID=A0ACC1XM83_MELAZ|nr:putative Sentrin/sumo-specific protease [Melia azedarach]
MGKRKPGGANNPIDLDSPTPDIPDHILKHRTCWLHTIASLHAKKMKKSIREIENFQLNAPCFRETIPCHKRSKKGGECKNPIFKQKKKLDSGEFECYMENLWRSFSEDKKTCFAYLDSLWFGLYRKATSRGKVLTWIKRKHIFSKKYVLVPIVCWSHWSLLIFCHFGESLESKTRTPCMLLLDSLEMANPRRLEPDIRKLVSDIFRAEGRLESKKLLSQIPLLVPKVPQQRNGEECGHFVLYFINQFVEAAPEDFNTNGYPYFMGKDWFSPEGLDQFCEKLNAFRK